MMTGKLSIALMIIVGLLTSTGSIAHDGGGLAGSRSGGNFGGGQRGGTTGNPSGDFGVHGFGGARGESGVHGFGSRGDSGTQGFGFRNDGRAGDRHFDAPRHHRHGGSGFFIESPYSQPSFYYWPYYTFQPYYSSPTVIVPSTPPAYIEQGTAPDTQSLEPNSWEYCSDPAGYYPYVQECPGGWQKTDPQPIEQQPGYWYYCDDPPGYYPYIRECSSVWRNVVP